MTPHTPRHSSLPGASPWPRQGSASIAILWARAPSLAKALSRRMSERAAFVMTRAIREAAEAYPEAAAHTTSKERARHFSARQEIAWQLRFAPDPIDFTLLAENCGGAPCQ